VKEKSKLHSMLSPFFSVKVELNPGVSSLAFDQCNSLSTPRRFHNAHRNN
jgi:hypothetical protein